MKKNGRGPFFCSCCPTSHLIKHAFLLYPPLPFSFNLIPAQTPPCPRHPLQKTKIQVDINRTSLVRVSTNALDFYVVECRKRKEKHIFRRQSASSLLYHPLLPSWILSKTKWNEIQVVLLLFNCYFCFVCVCVVEWDVQTPSLISLLVLNVWIISNPGWIYKHTQKTNEKTEGPSPHTHVHNHRWVGLLTSFFIIIFFFSPPLY
jgi:hypothetical protein